MDITYTVSITDIIQALGIGLGFPTAVWSTFSLFIKDKVKTRQLKSLEDIAISQNLAINIMTEQIKELSKQTAQFEYQSFLFNEANDLLKEQIRIQTDALLNDKDHKAAYLELERTKRKSEIKPFFKPTGGHTAGIVLTLPFANFGERAYFEGIEEIDTEHIMIMPQSLSERVIEKNENYDFTAKSTNDTYLGHNVPFEVNLLFYDEDKNKYKQNIKGIGVKANIETPEDR